MINNIQVLRAFAALNVVLFHIISTSASYGQGVSIFSVLEGWGQNGVDVFFVISGFVMVYTQTLNPKSAQAFLWNRVLRIVPLYWFFTLCLLLLTLFAPALFRELKPTFAHALGSFLLITGITVDKHPLVYVGWTLEYEMLFYGLFAGGILLRKKTIGFALTLLALLLLVVTGLSDAIVIEFAFGMLCANLYLSNRGRSLGLASLVMGVLLLTATVFIHTDLHRCIIYGIPSLLIVFGALHVPQTDNRLLVYLGAASYSIYLVQVFAIPAFYKVSSILLTYLPGDLLAVAAVCFTALLGCAVYELVEKPLGRFLGRGLKSSRHKLNTAVVTEHPAEEVAGR